MLGKIHKNLAMTFRSAATDACVTALLKSPQARMCMNKTVLVELHVP